MSWLAILALLLSTLAPLPPEPPPDVLVVRSETGAPLPGAEVFVFDIEAFQALVFPFSDTLEGAIEKHGTRLVADAQGAVRVTGSKLLWGRSGDRRGMLEGSPPLPEAFVLAPCARIDCGAIQVSAAGVDGATQLLMFNEGELRLDEVVLGARFHLLPLPYDDWRGPETEVEGPTQPGEAREHTLAFASVDRHGLGKVVAPEAGFYRIFVAGQRRVGSVIWSGAWTFTLALPE